MQRAPRRATRARPSAITVVNTRSRRKRSNPSRCPCCIRFPKISRATGFAFARWLVSPDNPLTPRVVMNRQWRRSSAGASSKQSRTSVIKASCPRTPSCSTGCAAEFIRQKWSMKAMHKLIVTSATCRQSSEEPRAKGEGKDSAQGQPYALRSELFASFPHSPGGGDHRDSILQSAGLLTTKVGGPSVDPPQPDSVTEAAYGRFQWKRQHRARPLSPQPLHLHEAHGTVCDVHHV